MGGGTVAWWVVMKDAHMAVMRATNRVALLGV